MIKLTRLRQNTPFILNPDHIERVDTHVDTVVRLTTGTEYLVNETGEEIVRLTAEFRARVISLAGTLDVWAMGNALAETTHVADGVDVPDATLAEVGEQTADEAVLEDAADEAVDQSADAAESIEATESVDAVPTAVEVAS